MPVAFVKQQGIVSLSSACSPASIAVNATTHCTTTSVNNAPVAANTDVSEKFLPTSKLLQSNFAESHTGTSTGGFVITGDNGYRWSGQLSASLPPTVDSLTPDTGPAGGYLPLSLFGVPAIGGTDDDTLINFNVPSFQYGHENYTRIGVGSNGYIVVGGGTSSDVAFVPQTMPNPARPNNVIAPYWTDLNPGVATGSNGIRIGTLTNGSDNWIVVDWQGVPVFGGTHNENFEIWVGVNGDANPVEDITYVYGHTDPDPGTPANAGAENRTGTSGQNSGIPSSGDLNGTGYRVNTSPATPGGAVTITYDVLGERAGSYSLTTSMTSDQTPGTTTVSTPITVHT
jgi:hypothetical protein